MTEQRAAYEAATIEAMHAQAAPVAPEPPDMEYTPITAPLPRLVRREELDAAKARIATLEAKLAAVPVDAVRRLRAHLSDGGDYSIVRADGEKMWIGDALALGSLFEAIDKWLDQSEAHL